MSSLEENKDMMSLEENKNIFPTVENTIVLDKDVSSSSKNIIMNNGSSSITNVNMASDVDSKPSFEDPVQVHKEERNHGDVSSLGRSEGHFHQPETVYVKEEPFSEEYYDDNGDDVYSASESNQVAFGIHEGGEMEINTVNYNDHFEQTTAHFKVEACLKSETESFMEDPNINEEMSVNCMDNIAMGSQECFKPNEFLSHAATSPVITESIIKTIMEKIEAQRKLFNTGQLFAIKCEICDKHYSSFSALKKHILIHTGEKPYNCDICGFNCNRVSNLKIHMQSHSNEKAYKCDLCGTAFNRRAYLTKHKISHVRINSLKNVKVYVNNDNDKKSFECELCNKVFSKLGPLRNHFRAHNKETHKCEICDKSFPESWDIKRHMIVHSNERPYNCDLCDKGFRQHGHLSKHMLTHTGERPYRCDTCDAAFSTSSNLKAHMSVHSPEKPYDCKVCEKCFARPSHLAQHMIVHTRERPFVCEVCGQSFTQTYIKRHMKIHNKPQ